MLWILLACNAEKPITDTAAVVTDTASDIEGTITDTDTQTEDTDTVDTGTIEPPPPPPKIVRFVALGDGGEGNDTQYKVADAMKTLCEAKTDDHDGCEFALYLGDNIYDDGVSSVLDAQFQDKFELPYADIEFPFYVVLGNHDAGGFGAGYAFYKTEFEVDYTHYSDKWTMPEKFYRFDVEHVRFFGLDTNQLMYEPWFGADDQKSWIDTQYTTDLKEWTIAFGHHPYISNGQHGNAGAYEGLELLAGTWGTDVPLGKGVKDFMDARLCGKADIYFSGHDHNRQWLEPTCGTEFIVTGAAAKTTDLQARGNATFFEDDGPGGFIWIEVKDNCLTGEFYDENGTMNFSHQFCK